MRGDDPKVGGDPISSFNLHQISCHHLLSIDLHLLPLTDNQGLLDGKRIVTKSEFGNVYWQISDRLETEYSMSARFSTISFQ